MLTRGFLIGKIIDDFGSLKYQIELRNKAGLGDLSKFCEDFIKDVLNATYSLNLINLNSDRSNAPGLDLGDKRSHIAYQVTSERTSDKVGETLSKIDDAQYEKYPDIRIFILGEKQKKYTIDEGLMESRGFSLSKIYDINDLIRDIAILDSTTLEAVYSIIERDFRKVKIELEPFDQSGSFESSIFNTIELMPNMPPQNSQKFLTFYEEEKFTHEQVCDTYKALSKTPRSSREIIALIYERSNNADDPYGDFWIHRLTLAKLMRLSLDEMDLEIQVLEQYSLISKDIIESGDDFVPTYEISHRLSCLLHYLSDNESSIRTAMNVLDFRVLDECENDPTKDN